jgi:sterol desaturase/sphingolipid hydroxylase (fatty acid hydroxylase superfamily)
MNAFEETVSAVGRWIWAYLVPHGESANQPFWSFALGSMSNVLKSYVGFIVLGVFIYLFFLRRKGEPISLLAALKHLFPETIYTHRSFRVDLLWLPLSWVMNFVLFAGLTLGSGAMQLWLVNRYGHVDWAVPAGGWAVALQVLFTLLGADIARFAWHYQGHKVAFFWEFHKGHHTPEVLHPVFIRTHPVDMFIRLAYMQVGGGLLGGGLMYLAGVDASTLAATWLTYIGAILHVLQGFEHSHVPISFGRRLDRIFYPPHFHPFHHGAQLKHRDKNFGITGGLTLWDKLAGTLYIPEPGEIPVLGSSMAERGENNPHRTLWRFLKEPFVAAAGTLVRR